MQNEAYAKESHFQKGPLTKYHGFTGKWRKILKKKEKHMLKYISTNTKDLEIGQLLVNRAMGSLF